ncbi:AraC family transcriptional regulator [Glycomyces sp. NPDC021274]|uniref:AraC family transcriptional regulator n=1 Tax=Glycomyces sp. NPDC021274 TaxID=3155120 RepID=UPI00340C7D29
MPDLEPTGTDPLTDLLERVRCAGAVFEQPTLAGRLLLTVPNGSPLTVAVPLRGRVRIAAAGAAPVDLAPGHVAILSGGAPYEITVQDTAGETRSAGLMTGRYTVKGGMPARLLAALPPLAVIETGPDDCPVSAAAFAEIDRTLPGRQAFLDRMLDLMLVAALRTWFTRPGAPVPDWYRAHGDAVTATALRLIDGNLAYRWTLAELAARTGVSRAALARRFADLVGQPPMTYLRERRLDRTAELLCDTDLTLAAIAARVGFSTPFALSAAFKRARGHNPSEHRARRRRAPDSPTSLPPGETKMCPPGMPLGQAAI